MSAPFTDARDVVAYALAGKATLTLESARTGARYTYRIEHKDERPAFVSVLSGPDNEADYQYLGTIHLGALQGDPPIYYHGRKSQIGPSAPSARAFAWAWGALARGLMPEALSVYHEGRCGRCGRKLTVPESIRTGLGPECATKGG